jgi:hypothetical protein
MDASQHANTVNRMIGLGQAPTSDLCDSLFQIGFTQVPVVEYVTWTTALPVSDTSIEATFGDEIDFYQSSKSVPGVDSVDSSFIQGGTLQVDMLAVGFGLHAFGEPLAFSQIGNAISPPPAPNTQAPVSPDVFTANDQASAIGIPSAGFSPAVFEWGVCDWEAIWHLVNAYQFQWIMQQRYLLINELAADVSYFGSYADASAAGTSDIPIQGYVRQTNDRYRDQCCGTGAGIFAPVNARRVGSVNVVTGGTTGGVGPTGGTGGAGVFHPTRDYDLAPTTWGGLRVQGGQGCCMPYRKFIRPVLLEKGIPIGAFLRAQDQYHLTQMQKFMSISESVGGNFANVAYDANIVDPARGIQELTLDQGGNQFASQSVQTNRVIFKGGVMKLAFLLKGFEVWGAWKQYLCGNACNQIYMPSVTGAASTGSMGILPMGR